MKTISALSFLVLWGSSACPAGAQSLPGEEAPLPAAVSDQQIQSLDALRAAQASQPEQSRARRRLPAGVVPMTEEELAFRAAVRSLGVSKHQFVHCELNDGKVRTGTIMRIDDDNFTLQDGIVVSHVIRYAQLKSAPRPVNAMGTRIGNGFKWTGMVAGLIAAIPLLVVLYPLIATGVLQD